MPSCQDASAFSAFSGLVSSQKVQKSRPQEEFQVSSSSLISNSTVVSFLVWNEKIHFSSELAWESNLYAYLGVLILHIYLGMLIFHVYLAMCIITCLLCCQKCLVSVLPVPCQCLSVPSSVLASALFSRVFAAFSASADIKIWTFKFLFISILQLSTSLLSFFYPLDMFWVSWVL